MYMRLWWKDLRQFWPIWTFLVVVAGGAQAVMALLAGPETRGNLLVPMAMGWTCLYAFAAGAAAFAGEREAGTLRLLDMLPAPRPVVWLGKVSFAIASTAVLAAVLVALAAMDGPPHPGASWGMPDRTAMILLGSTVLQAMAWGLLGSAIFPSALVAAVSAIVVTTLIRLRSMDTWFWYRGQGGGEWLTWELGLAGLAMAASLVAFTWARRDRRSPGVFRSPLGLRLRSPIEVTWSPPARTVPTRPVAPIAVAAEPAPRVVPAAAARAVDRPRPRSRSAELRGLLWQTMREGRATWLLLAAIALFWVAPWLVNWAMPVDPASVILWNGVVALTAGVGVFGLENRRRTYRFLAHHGARPGMVWLAKLLAWGIGLAIIWGPIGYLWLQHPTTMSERVARPSLMVFPLLTFSIAVLCGMAIPRGITAGVVALVFALLLGIGQTIMVVEGLLPPWGMAVLPLAFLAVSWAWSGDWLLDRPAPGRWVRLGAILSAVLGISFGGYVAERAWGIPDVGPIPTPSTWAPAPPSDDRDAAPLYREAAQQLNLSAPSAATRNQGLPVLESHPAELELIRRASLRPECRFFDPGRMTLLSRPEVPPMYKLGEAVAAQARHRLKAGDLDAAWDDVMTLFRMARHARQAATISLAPGSLALERSALVLAMEWSNAGSQSPDRLRAALAAYRGLPAIAPTAEVIRGEGLLLERTIGLPLEDLRDLVIDQQEGRPASTWELLRLDVIATPWERARSRRVNRLLTAEAASLMSLEPWRRPTGPLAAAIRRGILDPERFSLVTLLGANTRFVESFEDRTEVERRAPAYVMTIREWALRHDGRFPDRLEDLPAEDLAGLPNDPYSGRRFGYTTFAAARVADPSVDWSRVDRPPGGGAVASPGTTWPAEARLIYSVGIDGRDDHGRPVTTLSSGRGDVVFPIFPATPRKKGK